MKQNTLIIALFKVFIALWFMKYIFLKGNAYHSAYSSDGQTWRNMDYFTINAWVSVKTRYAIVNYRLLELEGIIFRPFKLHPTAEFMNQFKSSK